MKKFFHIIKNVFLTLIVIFALFMMVFTIISVTTLDKTDRSLFGYRAFIVLTDSMSKTDFKAGDLVIIKDVDPNTLKVDDIISYRSTNLDHYYEVVTHKIKRKVSNENGVPGFITYGTTTGAEDDEIVTYDNILGKYEFTLKGIGTFCQFLKTTPGYMLCIFAPFLLIIFIQAIHSIILFRKYKKAILIEMEEEKEKIKQEKLEAELIKQKLIASEEKAKIFEKELADLRREINNHQPSKKKHISRKKPSKNKKV